MIFRVFGAKPSPLPRVHPPCHVMCCGGRSWSVTDNGLSLASLVMLTFTAIAFYNHQNVYGAGYGVGTIVTLASHCAVRKWGSVSSAIDAFRSGAVLLQQTIPEIKGAGEDLARAEEGVVAVVSNIGLHSKALRETEGKAYEAAARVHGDADAIIGASKDMVALGSEYQSQFQDLKQILNLFKKELQDVTAVGALIEENMQLFSEKIVSMTRVQNQFISEEEKAREDICHDVVELGRAIIEFKQSIATGYARLEEEKKAISTQIAVLETAHVHITESYSEEDARRDRLAQLTQNVAEMEAKLTALKVEFARETSRLHEARQAHLATLRDLTALSARESEGTERGLDSAVHSIQTARSDMEGFAAEIRVSNQMIQKQIADLQKL